MNQTETQWI